MITELGAWGARSPVPPAATRIGADSIVFALGSLFDPERAGDLDAVCELRPDGQRFRVTIAGGEIELARGAAEDPALVLEGTSPDLAALITGKLGLEAALASGAVRIEGSRRAATRFLRLFRWPSAARARPIRPASLR